MIRSKQQENKAMKTAEEVIRDLEETIARDTSGGIIGADGSRAMNALAWYRQHPSDLPGGRRDPLTPEQRAKVNEIDEACETARLEWEAAGRRWMAAQAVEKELDSHEPEGGSRFNPATYVMNILSGDVLRGTDEKRQQARQATRQAFEEMEERRVVYERALSRQTDLRGRWPAATLAFDE